MALWNFKPMANKGTLSPTTRKEKHNPALPTLVDLPVGGIAKISAYLPQMPAGRLMQLKAYGVLPGSVVTICQQAPVTIFQVDQTEIALEWELARWVCVENI